ncbi:hypothetical protein [Prosthecobacter sp.]|uniref:hypothetical protein n=1 Tax=Prosthecobacter sp. TaxID=1965333 RepID=UPI00378522B8
MKSLLSFAILEVRLFFCAAVALMVWQMFTGKIRLKGLLADKERGLEVSPVRVQALLCTLGVAMHMLTQTATAGEAAQFPEVPPEALALIGGSQVLYLTTKAGALANRIL